VIFFDLVVGLGRCGGFFGVSASEIRKVKDAKALSKKIFNLDLSTSGLTFS